MSDRFELTGNSLPISVTQANRITEHTEETWNEKMSKDQEKFKTLIKSS
jgi:hypothetical protein